MSINIHAAPTSDMSQEDAEFVGAIYEILSRASLEKRPLLWELLENFGNIVKAVREIKRITSEIAPPDNQKELREILIQSFAEVVEI